MVEGPLKSRGPMGWRSASSRFEPEWEEASSYVPPLVYVIENRGSVLGSLKKILGRAEGKER